MVHLHLHRHFQLGIHGPSTNTAGPLIDKSPFSLSIWFSPLYVRDFLDGYRPCYRVRQSSVGFAKRGHDTSHLASTIKDCSRIYYSASRHVRDRLYSILSGIPSREYHETSIFRLVAFTSCIGRSSVRNLDHKFLQCRDVLQSTHQ